MTVLLEQSHSAQADFQKEFLRDIETLSTPALKKKYKLSADAHRTFTKRARQQGLEVDQDCADFRRFLVVMGGPRLSRKYSVDRIENNRGYVRGNVRWANHMTQTHNRSNSRKIDFNGEFVPIKAAAARLRVSADVVYKRRAAGWTDAEIIAGKRRGTPKHEGVWPQGKEDQFEALYQDEREDRDYGPETRLSFYLRTSRDLLRGAMGEMRAYGENMEQPPLDLLRRVQTAQGYVQDAEQKVRAACEARKKARYQDLF